MTGVGDLKQHLDELLNGAQAPEGDLQADDVAALAEAKRRFRAAGADLLLEVSGELWAYYDSTVAECSPGHRSAYGIPELPRSMDIWGAVSITAAPEVTLGRSTYAPAGVYFSFEGEVPWEPEHGLQLVVEDGRRVCKLGPYDGHLTNAAAFAEASLLPVVFKR